MTDKKLIKAIDIILKDITGKPCKGWDADCAQCKLYVLNGYLEWFKEILK